MLHFMVRMLITCLLILLLTRNGNGYVYTCDRLKQMLLTSTQTKNLPYFCVIPREANINNDVLERMYAIDDKGTTRFSTIAAGHEYCTLRQGPSWSIVVDSLQDIDCNRQQFTVILASDAPSIYRPSFKEHRLVLDTGFDMAFVSPTIGMHLHSIKCSGNGNITLFTGAGNLDTLQILQSWPCETVPRWIIVFDNVITIHRDGNATYEIDISNNFEHHMVIYPGDKMTILHNGRSDNQLNRMAGIRRINVELYNWITREVEVKTRIPKNIGSELEIRKYFKGQITPYSKGNNIHTFIANYFQLLYKPPSESPETRDSSDGDVLSRNPDTLVVDIRIGKDEWTRDEGTIKIVPNSSTHCNSSEPAHLYVTPILEMDPSTYSKISWHHILGLILIFANGYIYALCIKKQVEEMRLRKLFKSPLPLLPNQQNSGRPTLPYEGYQEYPTE